MATLALDDLTTAQRDLLAATPAVRNDLAWAPMAGRWQAFDAPEDGVYRDGGPLAAIPMPATAELGA